MWCNCNDCKLFFHIRTVRRDILKVFYSPVNAQVIVLKTVLKEISDLFRYSHTILRERIIP
jgi:hypothetical protein